MKQSPTPQQFSCFSAFYPYYLNEHKNRTCRWLHFIGTFLVIMLSLLTVYWSEPKILLLVPVVGYGFAWIGHFLFEKNRPATFKAPFYSLLANFRLFADMLMGKYH